MKMDDDQFEEDFLLWVGSKKTIKKESKREFYKTKEEIEKWLYDMDVEGCRVVNGPSNNYPFVVQANDVDLSNRGLEFIPVKFVKVDGYLNCSKNKLSDLSFCPNKVQGYLYLNSNNLVSLKGCSSIVNGDLDISNNSIKIDSLIDFPKHIDGIIKLENNFELTELDKLQDITNQSKEIKEAINKSKEKLINQNDLENELKINENNGKSGSGKIKV